MTRRRVRRREDKRQRHGSAQSTATSSEVVRRAQRVERLAYTRSQAAEALGLSRSTFNRRALPFMETIETGWGSTLIPVDEVERFVAERRRAARQRPSGGAARGRPARVPVEVVDEIRAAHRDNGKSLGAIARDLNARGVPTAQGGRQWWSSTVRSVLRTRGAL